MSNSKLQKAIENLKIADLYVRDLVSKCHDDFDPKYADMNDVAIQTKHMVTKSDVVQNDDGDTLFRVFVEVGVKWVNEGEQEQIDVDYLAWIEAAFVAEYDIIGQLDDECLGEFALKNVSYHVWPYWRELLTSQCDRMRLPRLLLPMTQISDNQDATTEPL